MSTPGAARPEVGSAAPDFTLPDQHGAPTTLSSLRGHRAALVVFYPFAFSSICTGELTGLRDDLASFSNDEVQLLAVSCDPVFALRAWSDEQGFAFPLLSDFWPHGAVASSYGVFDEQLGRADRGTFLVDATGVVRWSVVNHPGEARDLDAYRAAVAAL
ncbi:MAG TPA: peroxiredoxin [Actinomycetales bacterium]|nr:peroxiredoxin [Actinomycetales bacterium]